MGRTAQRGCEAGARGEATVLRSLEIAAAARWGRRPRPHVEPYGTRGLLQIGARLLAFDAAGQRPMAADPRRRPSCEEAMSRRLSDATTEQSSQSLVRR
ncbi:hypothetical protein ACP70R_008887 [Stipagrostis hirtigluma subsp. patula]